MPVGIDRFEVGAARPRPLPLSYNDDEDDDDPMHMLHVNCPDEMVMLQSLYAHLPRRVSDDHKQSRMGVTHPKET